MKKLHPLHLLVLAVALLLSPGAFAQSLYPCPTDSQRVDLRNEFRISVNQRPYRITQDQIDEKRDFFEERIRFSGNPNLASQRIEAIDVVSVLYCEAERLRREHHIAQYTYVTGVWMIIGMENNTASYFFRPAVLTIESNIDTVYTFEIAHEGHVYGYRNDAFYNDDAGWQQKQDAYFENVRIKHVANILAGHTRARFRNSDGSLDNTWRGDTRQVFYSFQEIIGFYEEHNTHEKPGNYYSSAIHINHSAANFTSNPKGWNSWRAKHNNFITVETNRIINNRVAITAAIDQKNTDPGTNLAHVCPSVCNRLQYSGAQRDQSAAAEAKK